MSFRCDLNTSTSWLAVTVLLTAVLIGCHRPPTGRDPASILRRGLGGDVSSLDPASTADSFSGQVLQDLYEGLTTESPTGEVKPGVAASWAVDPSGTRYTFHLRSDARWSNGKPVRAGEFVAAWRRVLDPNTRSPVADDLRIMAGAPAILAGHAPPESLQVSAPADDVLIVNLERPAAFLPEILTHSCAYPVYSAAAARTHQPAEWVSNGAYVLAEWQPGARIGLTKNAKYWNAGGVGITTVAYEVAADQNSQVAQYRAGQLDMTDSVPPNAISLLRQSIPHELRVAPYLATAYYGLNMDHEPAASRLPLRRALAMAVDRQRLVESLAFGQTAAFGIVPPATWNYAPQRWPWDTLGDAERISQAQAWYAKAGYSAAKPLHLRLLFNASSVIKQTAIVIAAMWTETLGVETEFVEEEYRVFLQSRRDRGRWDVARLAWNADFNDASNFLDIFRSHSPNNDEGYANPAFDALMDQAAAAPDARSRRMLLESAERLMLNDYPVIPLYHFVSKRLVKPYVHKVQPDPLNRIPSQNLTLSPH